MNKEMIISSNGHDTRVAILEDDQVVEIFIERENQRGVVGNVYKGRVSKVLPGMQSSFVDIGLERDAFLYVSEVVTPAEFEKVEGADDEDGPAAVPALGDAPDIPAEAVDLVAGGTPAAAAVAERAAGAPIGTARLPRLTRREGPPRSPHRGPAQGRAGSPRPGRQGTARHQGRTAHLARHDAGPLPGVHADCRSRRRVAQDRIARRARPPSRHRQGVPRGARLHRRRHHPHRRLRHDPKKTSSATSPTSTRCGPRSAAGWRRAVRRRSCSRSRAWSPSCCATCSPTITARSGSTTSRSTGACWRWSSGSCRT